MHPDKPRNNKPTVYVFFGMIGTGKTSLSQAWAGYKNIRFYNSDRVRKELAGIRPTARRDQTVDTGIYTKEFSRKTYEALLEKAEAELNKGDSVVLDASYQYAHDRHGVSRLAKKADSQVYFILCQCDEAVMKYRMQQRRHDTANVSDGRWEIYLKQRERFEPPDEIPSSDLVSIDTDAPLEDLLKQLKKSFPDQDAAT